MPEKQPSQNEINSSGSIIPPKGAKKWREWCIFGFIIVITIFIIITFILPSLGLSIFSSGGCQCITRLPTAIVYQPDNSTIILNYGGGGIGSDSMNGLTATVTDSNGRVQSKTIGNKSGFQGDFSWQVALGLEYAENHYVIPPPLAKNQTVMFTGNYARNDDHVVAIAHYSDGENIQFIDKNI